MYPDLHEAIEDLLQIFPDMCSIFRSTYNEYKNNPEKVVTLIWTSSTKITKLINFALIVDAAKHFDYFDKSEYEFFEDYTIVYHFSNYYC